MYGNTPILNTQFYIKGLLVVQEFCGTECLDWGQYYANLKKNEKKQTQFLIGF